MRKTIATVAAVSAVGGFAGGAVLTAGQGAVAQTETTPTDEVSDSRAERIVDALSGLVDDGTITQTQAEAVGQELADRFPGRGHDGFRGGFGSFDSAELLELLQLDEAALREQLLSGATLAEITEAQGVDADAVAEILVDQARARLDEAVAEGRIDEAAAETLAGEIESRVDDLINGEVPPHRGHGRGFRGHTPDGDTTEDSAA